MTPLGSVPRVASALLAVFLTCAGHTELVALNLLISVLMADQSFGRLSMLQFPVTPTLSKRIANCLSVLQDDLEGKVPSWFCVLGLLNSGDIAAFSCQG